MRNTFPLLVKTDSSLLRRSNLETLQANLGYRCNMPIQRFGSQLVTRNEFHEYMHLLKGAHRDVNLAGVMCKTMISVSWTGHVHDCDFNQMLGLPLGVLPTQTHLPEL